MTFLEKFLPSLRRSPAIAQIKKEIEEEKGENIRARDRVLESVSQMMDDFDLLNGRRRKQELAHAKGGKGRTGK